MSASGGSGVVERLKSLGSIGENSIRRSLFLLVIAPIASFAFGIVDLIDAAFSLFIIPLQSFTQGIGELVLALIGGAADIISAGSGAAARSFLTGIWSALGPLSFPVSIAAVGVGAFVLARVLQEQETSDVPFLLFSSTDFPDLPLVGNVGAEEEDEEGDE